MTDAMRQVDLLRAACCVAGADGETSDSERRVLQRLANQAGVGAASFSAMIECAETDETFYKTQFRAAVSKPQETLLLLFRMAILDGKLRKEEVVMLKRLSGRIGVEPAQFDEWLQQFVDSARKKPAKTDE